MEFKDLPVGSRFIWSYATMEDGTHIKVSGTEYRNPAGDLKAARTRATVVQHPADK